MYILDSSAIAIILKRLREKSVEILEDKITLDLARYELGNVIWKECTVEGLISPEEASNRAEDMAKILEIMGNEEIKSSEDFRGVMKLATGLKLTFYDASYLHLAKSKGLTLVTEDEELSGKAKHINIKAITVSELLRSQSPNTPQ
ncbi:MAG: type II toxin-antitoxin system VapC family toxin [Candidatus Bathyarchaeia archaeon]